MSVKAVQGWVEKVFLDIAFEKEVSLLRTKSRDKVGTVSTVGRQLLTGQGEWAVFVG